MTTVWLSIVSLAGLVTVLVLVFLLRYAFRRKTATDGTDFSGMQSATVRDYKPENVGNDASARPWEYASGGYTPSDASNGLSAPAGFDAVSFLKTSKINFVVLQQAWDRADIAYLRAMMTDDMLELIKSQLAEREARGSLDPKTEVLMLDARLLGIEERHRVCWASVEFSGLIREQNSAGARPFRELWNLSKPLSGERDWLVAGVQALH